MRRATLLILVLSVSGASYAEDPFACVDPEVANAFLRTWQRDIPSYSTSIPNEFVILDVPPSLTLVGSQNDANMTKVVFRTSMGIEDAFLASTGAIAVAGWVEKIDEGILARRGFQSVQESIGSRFCHESQPGVLSVTARKRTEQTLVSFVHYTDTESQGCAEPASAAPGYHPRELMEKLPLLKLPEGVTARHMGTGGSGEEVNTRVALSSPTGQIDLISYFGDQIRDQGWVYESGWSGSYSSGTVWTNDTPDDGVLIGKLHVYGGDSHPIRMRFSIIPVDPTKNTYKGGWSSTTN